MITVDCVQGSPEWFEARLGIPTASNFDKIITTNGAKSKQAEKYMYQLAVERVTGQSEDAYSNAKMQRGQELEAEARSLYEMLRGHKIEQVGVCFPDEKRRFGASPDGVVDKDGLAQIKCPMAYAAVGYLLDPKLPTDYIQQVQGELLVTGRKWSDFISYYPGGPRGSIKPLIVRVERDEVFIKLLRNALEDFCAELDSLTERIRQ